MACPAWPRGIPDWLRGQEWDQLGCPSACPAVHAMALAREGWEESRHMTVRNQALNLGQRPFLLACACADVAVFRTGEQ